MERERKSFKSGGFIGKNECTSKGYVERERRGGDFSGLALLTSQKWCFFLAKNNAPVGVSKGLVGPRSLRLRAPITNNLLEGMRNKGGFNG